MNAKPGDVVLVRAVVERVDDDGEVRLRLSTGEAVSVPASDIAELVVTSAQPKEKP